MAEPYVIPPSGPTLSLASWSAIVTEHVRRLIPEVRAARAGRSFVWRHNTRTAILMANGDTWSATFTDSAVGATPTLASIHLDRHDVFTAAVFGKTLPAFFEDRYSSG
jgi:hypothetical protein